MTSLNTTFTLNTFSLYLEFSVPLSVRLPETGFIFYENHLTFVNRISLIPKVLCLSLRRSVFDPNGLRYILRVNFDLKSLVYSKLDSDGVGDIE